METNTPTYFSLSYFRFVDYQLCHFTNPAQDLQYFLHTSPSTSLMEKHGLLVEEYYRTLEETFILLGHQHLCPSLQQLHKQLDNKGRYAVIVSCTVLPFVLVDRSSVPNFEKVMKEEESVHFSDKYKDVLKTFLPLFEQRGWLEM
jgi:hypothetical protein